jgi:hypothetical protein
MFKRILLTVLLVGSFSALSTTEANAWIVRRVAPVRRVAARAVLPPYPIARRVVAGPIYRRPIAYARPVVYRAPVVLAPRVSVGYYGW